MGAKLKKRYGLAMAIAMVVGIVIGSGVFFKAEKILVATKGDLKLGILSWILGGIIMIVCAYAFAILGTKYEKESGLIDYAEAVVGRKYGYMVGWFMAALYFPSLTAVIGWVPARYICALLGMDITSGGCMAIGAAIILLSFGLNTLGPMLSEKFQVSTTVIKLIPLYAMAIIGSIVGLGNGTTMQNFKAVTTEHGMVGSTLLAAVVASSFAYEGWIVATSINAELKDAKKNLPRALAWGSIIIVVTYVLYYIGLAGAVSNDVVMASGEQGAKIAFSNLFSRIGGIGLFIFVIISCLGTLNGMMLGCLRAWHALAARNEGYKPELLSQVDEKTNMPVNSAVLSITLTGIWYAYFYGANLVPKPWFGVFSFDTSELPIITLYAMYIPIFLLMMKTERLHNPFKHYVVPILAILACIFMLIATIITYKVTVVYYLLVFAVIMIVGLVKVNRPEKLS